MGLRFLFGVKIIHLKYRTEVFKIRNFGLSRKAIVTDLYSSLEGQREWENERERERERQDQ
jgi:hypothetical protein